MSTVRRGRMAADDFATVSRKFARDSRLSLKARGLGLWLFTHQDGWNLSVRSIAKQVGAGVESVQSALKELEEHGYLRREQPNENGRFGDMDYVVTDTPDVPAGETAYGKPGHGADPEPESPADGPTADRETDTHKETTPKETNGEGDQPQEAHSVNGSSAVNDGGLFTVDAPNGDTPPDAPMDDRLEELWLAFWAAYPLKKAKQGARKSWDSQLRRRAPKARVELAEAMVAGVHRYAEQRMREEPRDAARRAQFTKQPTTWLNQGCWEDEVVPVGSGRNPRGGREVYRDRETYPDTPAWFDPAALDDET